LEKDRVGIAASLATDGVG